jgi:hypothetical protein
MTEYWPNGVAKFTDEETARARALALVLFDRLDSQGRFASCGLPLDPYRSEETKQPLPQE